MADPINGSIKLDVDEKFMNARLSITPPKNGGKPVTEEEVRNAMALNGIRYNVNEEAIQKAFTNGGLSVLLAQGVAPVDGKDGYFTYHFERKSGVQMKADEFGNVDYHDLGLIQNIEKGVVIADIIPETKGTPGKDIRGIELPQYPGKPVKLNIGNGIALSEDGTKLVTAYEGNLRWSKDHFVVDKVLVVSDIDLSVGNIDFIGDIIIKGNVNEGFVVRSGGNVTIAGSVTNATIEAEGNISGKLGFLNSKIRAGGDITVNFGENSDITADGAITAQSFVGCNVVCKGNLTVQGGKSVIVGGKYTCMSNIEANYIGADSYIKTLIVLGNVAVLAEELIDLKKKVKELEGQLNQLEMVVSTLNQQKKVAPLTPEREEMLKRSVKAKFSHMGSIKETKDRIADIENEIENTNDLCIKVKRAVFPGVTIRINNSQLVVAQKTGACTIRMDEKKDVVIR
ncbi:MAG: DUF342 domain-containing protein [Ruminiclostridium sp.]|nr:DUF342 domain-containing protein [Ruminiclostridium sp.]